MDKYTSFAYDMPHNEPVLITAKCRVHFRPHEDWIGTRYGFDWMRMADTSAPGDEQPYKKIVAKQYTVDPRTKKYVEEMNPNAYGGAFKEDEGLYKRLETEYQAGCWIPPAIMTETGKLGTYYCPWLSLYPKGPSLGPVLAKNYRATLRLYLEIDEAPDKLVFGENDYFEISPNEISSDLKKGTYFWNEGKTVSIECKGPFFYDQRIEVFAVKKNALTGEDEKKLAGCLMVWANLHRRKTLKVLFVQVMTPKGDGKNWYTGKFVGQNEVLDNFLRQALIVPSITTEVLDVTGDRNFQLKGKYRHSTTGRILAFYDPVLNIVNKRWEKHPKEPAGFSSLETYLYQKLQDKLGAEKKDTYKDHTIVFSLGESGGCMDSDGSMAWLNGYSGAHIVMFDGYDTASITHEILHALELPHSFSNPSATQNRAFCTYQYAETENLMDYSHHVNIPRFALWHWQWRLANGNV